MVKAFNTIHWQRLRAEGRPEGAAGRLAVPIAGDDAAAKEIVAGLIDRIGFDRSTPARWPTGAASSRAPRSTTSP